MFHRMKFTNCRIGDMPQRSKTMSALGEWIRVHLERKGKNQKWLAEKIGVKPPQMSRIISGSSDTTPDILVAIADALGQRRSEIFRAAGYIETLTEEETQREQLIFETRDLTDEEKREVIAFIRMKKSLRENVNGNNR